MFGRNTGGVRLRRTTAPASGTLASTAKVYALGVVPTSPWAAHVSPAMPYQGSNRRDTPALPWFAVPTSLPRLPHSPVALPAATSVPTSTSATSTSATSPSPATTAQPPTAQDPGYAYLALRPEAAFEAVFDREKARLFHLAYSVLHDRAEAEDAVQETMWKAWKAWQSVRDESKRNAWLTKICLRHCLRRKQRLDRSTPWDTTAPETADRGSAPGELVGSATSISPPVTDPDLDRAYRKLPPKQRAAVVLHYHHGYSVEQTAELMGCRAGTVRTHVQRALANLRKELGDA